jgi:hypothetical protein
MWFGVAACAGAAACQTDGLTDGLAAPACFLKCDPADDSSIMIFTMTWEG